MSEDGDSGATSVDDAASSVASEPVDDGGGFDSTGVDPTTDDAWSDTSSTTSSGTSGDATVGDDVAAAETSPSVDAALELAPGAEGAPSAGLVDAELGVVEGGAVEGGGVVGGVVTAAGPVMVDPSTVVGRPDLEQEYFRYQGTGNADCGPYSAAMALNALTGGRGPSPEEVVEFARQQGWMTQDLVNGNPDWGYWSGMTPENLDELMDAYLAPSGGDSDLSAGTADRLDGHLAAGHPVMVMVDSGELQEGGVYDASGEQSPNHFLQVTGIDRVHGQVFLNDPAKTAPSVMPLAQFEAAWQDSGNLMLEVRAGTSSPSSTTDPFGELPADRAPLVGLPSRAPSALGPGPSVPPTSGLLADPTLAAVPPAPVPADGCCVLPMTLQLTPLGTAPVAPPDPSAAPGQSVIPNQAGPVGGGIGPLVPLAAGIPVVESIDAHHLKLNYVPEQIGVAPAAAPAANATPVGSGSSGNLFETANTLANVSSNIIEPGITQSGSPSTGLVFGAANGTFATFGEARDARDGR